MISISLTNAQKQKIENDFSVVLGNGYASNLLNEMSSCSDDEKICLKFLYAYMPISDAATYAPEFFIKSVREILTTRENQPWAPKVTGELFLNYVLPIRLNNEDLTLHRELIFNELFQRVCKLSLKDAILEVNYWCLEKATYQSTDIRTSSPINVIRNAFGRCGEESVLCVAALRSVGIPARQCYTPRWAHCDDNHAWVEVWVDGVWHCIGACEPEAVLDKGWFVETSKRGMLVHARAFSGLVSEPEITNQTDVITQVNVLNHYTKTKQLLVHVHDDKNAPVENVDVRFELINYAELYPLAIIKTDKNGDAHMMTGCGELYIHICKDGKFMHKKADITCEKLDFCFSNAKSNDSTDESLDLVPPPAVAVIDEELSEEAVKCHNDKIANANAIRKAFEDTFIRGEKAEAYANKFSGFHSEIAECVSLSNGNYKEICDFLETQNEIPLEYRVRLLKSLNKKDMSDITCDILNSHINSAYCFQNGMSNDLFVKYVLCPRVYFEVISDYRAFILNYFSDLQKQEFISIPFEIYRYITDNITDCESRDYQTIFATPSGLLTLKTGSKMSRKILFVAICRTLGIPARMSEIDQKVEFYRNNAWQAIDDNAENVAERNCILTLTKTDEQEFIYTKNFTVGKLTNGAYKTLGFEEISFSQNSISYKLEAGEYRIITANRLHDGSVLAQLSYITLMAGEEKTVALTLRNQDINKDEMVSMPNVSISTLDGNVTSVYDSIDKIAPNQTCSVAFIEEGKEPTEHLLNEMMEQKDKFVQNKHKMLVVVFGKNSLENQLLKTATDNIGYSVAVLENKSELENVFEALGMKNYKFPLVIGLDEGKNCVFHTAGYNVGTGDLLLKHYSGK